MTPASNAETDRSLSAGSLARRLVSWFDSRLSYAVALSGGVDSAVVAQAAAFSESPCVAVTSASASVAQRELCDAEQIATQVGLPHKQIVTPEVSDPEYQRNDARRCFHCKTHLFAAIGSRFPTHVIVSGTNADDLGDYRPGLEAAENAAVRAPLAELGLTKADVRTLARYWNLPLAEKPASPCLASRLAYGVSVTPERLSQVEEAESQLHRLGFAECRVRIHAGELARIEVPRHRLAEVVASEALDDLVAELRRLGFRFVTLDLEGFRSGSLNQLVQIAARPGGSD